MAVGTGGCRSVPAVYSQAITAGVIPLLHFLLRKRAGMSLPAASVAEALPYLPHAKAYGGGSADMSQRKYGPPASSYHQERAGLSADKAVAPRSPRCYKRKGERRAGGEEGGSPEPPGYRPVFS